jgi:SAM-dependent methyltransferase
VDRYHRRAGLTMREREQLYWDSAAGAAAGPWRRARKAVTGKGLAYGARLALRWIMLPLWQLSGKVFRRGFTFRSTHYPYFVHNYNFTWCNERAVEIPIVWAEVRARRDARVLEVGNVLSHYFEVAHDVIDKFERASGVRNEDVVSFRADRPYDLIVSISTLEHVGWDDDGPRDPGKFDRALANLCAQLAPGGRLVATLPLGYNPHLDALLASARPFSSCYFLRRRGMTAWREVDWPSIAGAAYDERWPGAQGLVIGVVER